MGLYRNEDIAHMQFIQTEKKRTQHTWTTAKNHSTTSSTRKKGKLQSVTIHIASVIALIYTDHYFPFGMHFLIDLKCKIKVNVKLNLHDFSLRFFGSCISLEVWKEIECMVYSEHKWLEINLIKTSITSKILFLSHWFNAIKIEEDERTATVNRHTTHSITTS